MQTSDAVASLGSGTNEHDPPFYLRLGMIRKRDDLDVLLQKIADAGKETEIALKYVEDMAEKIRVGIEKVQQDLKDENQQLLAQEGLLRQLPVISSKRRRAPWVGLPLYFAHFRCFRHHVVVESITQRFTVGDERTLVRSERWLCRIHGRYLRLPCSISTLQVWFVLGYAENIICCFSSSR